MNPAISPAPLAARQREIEAEAVQGVIAAILERILPKFEAELLEIYMVPLNTAAGLLSLSPESAARVLRDHQALTSFGPRGKRVSLAGIKRVIEARKVKAKTKGTK